MSWLAKINDVVNRRKKSRFDLEHAQYPITVDCEVGYYRGHLINVTQEGAKICLENDLTQTIARGTKANIRLRLIGGEDEFAVPVELVWLTHRQDDDTTLLGCRFREVSTQQTRLLSDVAEYCARLK